MGRIRSSNKQVLTYYRRHRRLRLLKKGGRTRLCWGCMEEIKIK